MRSTILTFDSLEAKCTCLVDLKWILLSSCGCAWLDLDCLHQNNVNIIRPVGLCAPLDGEELSLIILTSLKNFHSCICSLIHLPDFYCFYCSPKALRQSCGRLKDGPDFQESNGDDETPKHSFKC